MNSAHILRRLLCMALGGILIAAGGTVSVILCAATVVAFPHDVHLALGLLVAAAAVSWVSSQCAGECFLAANLIQPRPTDARTKNEG